MREGGRGWGVEGGGGGEDVLGRRGGAVEVEEEG